jgi:hypothetical protein
VLTAFLVESYKNLSPDTPSQMLVVMQQVSAQMTSFNTPFGMINSTYQPLLPAPPTGEQHFEPSSSDIRVNVLWFASLVFSLVTASFGILVKQWLREYLAVKNPSPQARLRIRHFRNPELEKWMVVEIAAVLPLLQQLSLALFFIGLCYFTASVHSSIGRTTLPLVAGWAFCFTTVTILPLFFPRCPYKTALLKRLLISIHFRLARLLRQFSQWSSIVPNLGRKFRATSRGFTQLLSKHIEKSDEQAILASETVDLEILAEVDIVQSNDELLGTAIFDALQQIHNPNFGDSIQFVLRVLGHRLSRDDLASVKPAPLDLRSLSRPGYNAIIRILSYMLKTYDLYNLLRKEGGILALHILFAPSRFIPSASDLSPLKPIFTDVYYCRETAKEIVSSYYAGSTTTYASTNFKNLLGSIPQVLKALNIELEVSLAFLEGALETWFKKRQPNLPLPDKFIITGDLKAWPWSWNELEPVFDFLSKIIEQALNCSNTRPQAPFELADLGHHTHTQALTSRSPGNQLSDALCGMYNVLAIRKHWSDHIQWMSQRTVLNCLETKEYTLALLDAIRRVDTAVFVEHYPGNVVFYAELGPPLSISHINNIVICLNQFQTTSQNSNENPDPVKPEYALRLLCFCVCVVPLQIYGTVEYVAQWHTLFDTLIGLTHQSLLAACASSSTLPDSRQELSIADIAHYITKLTQSQAASVKRCSRIAKACLHYFRMVVTKLITLVIPDTLLVEPNLSFGIPSQVHEANVDRAVLNVWSSYNKGWEMLAVIYFASSKVNPDSESPWWWWDLKPEMKKSICTALTAAARGSASPSTSLAETPPAITGDIANDTPVNSVLAADTSVDHDGMPHSSPWLAIILIEEVIVNQDPVNIADSKVLENTGANLTMDKERA